MCDDVLELNAYMGGGVRLHCARTDEHDGREVSGGQHRARMNARLYEWGMPSFGRAGRDRRKGWWFG